MTTAEWTETVPEQRSDDPLANFGFQLVPKEEPASPTAIAWIEAAMADGKSVGNLAGVKDQATFDMLRSALRKAAKELHVTVTCNPVKDKKGNLTDLSFTVSGRRGRKSD